MRDRLNNSWSRDERFTGRIGWTPKGQDEYVFSYVNLKGQKGVPLYQGPNTVATYRFFLGLAVLGRGQLLFPLQY